MLSAAHEVDGGVTMVVEVEVVVVGGWVDPAFDPIATHPRPPPTPGT